MKTNPSAEALRRQLGFSAVASLVVGDMLGSGIFFTPGELAAVARAPWQVYFFWGLSGLIILCGALTLAELSSLLPQSGASFHIIREGFGPFWAFLKIWMEMWVSGPGSVAGVAIVFGTYFAEFLGVRSGWRPPVWGVAAIAVFAGINLLGVQWGGWTQVLLTAVKIVALLALVFGTLLLVDPPAGGQAGHASAEAGSLGGLFSFIKLVGLGLGAVMFTYDGWIDVSHVAGEVVNPRKNLSAGLYLGVGAVTLIYLLVNFAYLRVEPLEAMREAPSLVASRVAQQVFGPTGGNFITGLIMISIFGALGGLVMTFPRLVYAAASRYRDLTAASHGLQPYLRALSLVSSRTAVPAGSIVFSVLMSSAALLFFGSFSRIVNFFVVPLQATNILMVAAIFKLRKRSSRSPDAYHAPGYPFIPLVYIAVMALFLLSALYYRPGDTLIGVALTATGVPVYRWLGGKDLA
ncbi:MAG: amino acid permease [Acidobacteria bacterium]|nr:amino acid permease [Acidobacteriota bacterium]